jgi:tetrahydromethanopterin S-methyltransferase subunit G
MHHRSSRINPDMAEKSPSSTPKREYPKFFEKSIPIAIGILVVIIIGMLIFAFGVLLGLIPGI